MSTLRKVDFHDTGPPCAKDIELCKLLDGVGERKYFCSAGGLTQIDLLTDLSVIELQKLIVDNFDFVGSFRIDGELKIVHGRNEPNDQEQQLAAAE